MASLTQWMWVWVDSGVGDGQGGLACCGSWDLDYCDTEWFALEIILSFLRLHPSTAFRTLVDYEGYSISSKAFLPTVVDIMVI